MRSLLFTVALLFVISQNVKSATCYSTGNGDWNDPLTWSCGTVPAPGDTIYIQAGHIVTLNSTEILYGAPMVIYIDGTFLFDSPGAKLHLECGSEVHVNPGGVILSSGIGQPSHNIKICGQLVWEGVDGPLTGPIVLQNPLPIELVSFTVKQEFTELIFEWRTASEFNNDYFTIEGSVDGFEWDEIVYSDGAGTSSIELNYQEEYDNRATNYKYFKLKQTDFDGKSEYSKIIALEQRVFETFSMYPNPVVQGDVKIEFQRIGEYTVHLYALNGMRLQEVIVVNSNEAWISVESLIPGMYILNATDIYGNVQVKKLQKL